MVKGSSTRYILYQPHFSQHLCGEDSEYSKEYFHLGFGEQSIPNGVRHASMLCCCNLSN